MEREQVLYPRDSEGLRPGVPQMSQRRLPKQHPNREDAHKRPLRPSGYLRHRGSALLLILAHFLCARQLQHHHPPSDRLENQDLGFVQGHCPRTRSAVGPLRLLTLSRTAKSLRHRFLGNPKHPPSARLCQAQISRGRCSPRRQDRLTEHLSREEMKTPRLGAKRGAAG